MKILELPPYYYPEQIASSLFTNDLEEMLISAGFVFEILAPSPTRGISDETRKKFGKKRYDSRYDGKMTVRRFPMFREGRSPVFRAIRYVLVNLIQYSKSRKAKDADVIFGASTPPTQGLLCALVKKRMKVPFVYNLQDVFPDSMVNAGMIREGSIIWRFGRKIEDYTYQHADQIITISENIKQNIIAKGVPENKIRVIPNWVDTDVVRPVPKMDNQLFDELGLDREKFIVTYAGTLGPAQNVELMLDAAELLKENNNILFVVFGDGSEKEKLAARIRQMNNVKLFPLLPPERISEVYSLGDISVVMTRKGVGGSAMPSKTLNILSCGRPVLASFDHGTELEGILNDHRCGKLVAAGKHHLLADEVRWFYEHPSQCAEMGDNARRYAVGNAAKQLCTAKYLQVFREVIHT